MKLKYILTAFILFVILGQVHAQSDKIRKNSVYFEGLGAGIIYSFNYDRLLILKNSLKFGASGGIYYGQGGEELNFTFPFSFYGLIGKNNYHIEYGLGPTFVYSKSFSSFPGSSRERIMNNLLLSTKLGFRYQRPKGGLFLRLTFNPFIEFVSFTTNKYFDHNNKLVSKETITSTFESNIGIFSLITPGMFTPWIGASIGVTF